VPCVLKKTFVSFFILLSLALPLSAYGAQEPAAAGTVLAGAAPVETLAKQAVIIENATGDVLFAKDADAPMPTSSMSKVMTMYLVFEAVKEGRLSMNQDVTISMNAWKQEGSRMFVNAGEQVKVEDLARGVIVQSGNDAAVALAEAVAGTESAFAALMNAKAQTLGLKQAHFMNATGLPHPQHYASARDLGVLAISLIRDFPEHYHFYSEKEFVYNKIKQGNRNPLLYRNMGVDGVKTGHTDAAGYGLIASALRDGRRIVVVVNGLKTLQERADEPSKLIEWAYREYGLYKLIDGEEKVAEARVWLGLAPVVAVVPEKSMLKSLPRSMKNGVKVALTVDGETEAPIRKGQKLGKAVITGLESQAIEIPLLAAADVPRINALKALWHRLKRRMGKE